ncbi:right-handed parallel beta-helix repeat-containing protein [Microbulbifer sp. SSSA008]|uniref:right-handed parallel beta-helix repeat-containing protein n=1 Tax=unclassified Microbulbifer TaxID=2619833 RepID=UPI002B2FE8E1|nr:right-handed parallel beta-helix repeat-containing protein [Microbulbifer sp. MKSA007]
MKKCKFHVTIIFSGLLIPLSAVAVECGDTITSPTTLTEDLICEVTEPDQIVLTVDGPTGIFDMDGYQLTCIDESNQADAAILLTGTGAQVFDGSITGCGRGIVAEGEGGHVIYSMNLTDMFGDLIYVETNNTVIRDNTLSTTQSGDGVELRGNSNIVLRNTLTNIDNSGIELRGMFNSITFNNISGSGNQGIEVNGQFTNVFSNIVTDGLNDGIAVGEGDEGDKADFSTVSNNLVTGNAGLGIPIRFTSSTLITQNTVEDNGEGGIGIFIEGSEFNKIVRNTSLNNSPYDLEDDTDPGDCSGTNTWVFNTFTAAEPACLD